MPVIKREITRKIASSIVQSGQFLHVIVGPRQVGKSTAAKQIAQDLGLPTHSVSADGPEMRTATWLEEQWQIALALGSEERPALLPLYPSHSSRASKPKIIVQNNALITAITDRSFEETAHNSYRIGRLAENAVGAHLLNTLKPSEYRVSYFRERVRGRDLEVDFVVTRGDAVVALEVTTAESHSRAGIEAFKQQVPSARAIIVGPGGIPLADFLSTHPQQFF